MLAKKVLLIISLLTISLQCMADEIELYDTLITPSYFIQVKSHCGDRDFIHFVNFTVIDRKNNTKQSFKGKAITSNCSEEKGCDFLGYTFKDNNKLYVLYEENPAIDIFENNKVLFTEKGNWFYSTKEAEIPSTTNALVNNEQCWEIASPEGEMTFYDKPCFYVGQNLQQVYTSYKKKGIKNNYETQYLDKLLPTKNFKRTFDYHNEAYKGLMQIEYFWPNSKELYIAFSYGGGVTTYIFRERSNGTVVFTIAYPD